MRIPGDIGSWVTIFLLLPSGARTTDRVKKKETFHSDHAARVAGIVLKPKKPPKPEDLSLNHRSSGGKSGMNEQEINTQRERETIRMRLEEISKWTNGGSLKETCPPFFRLFHNIYIYIYSHFRSTLSCIYIYTHTRLFVSPGIFLSLSIYMLAIPLLVYTSGSLYRVVFYKRQWGAHPVVKRRQWKWRLHFWYNARHSQTDKNRRGTLSKSYLYPVRYQDEKCTV